jgi:hypothetical protein
MATNREDWYSTNPQDLHLGEVHFEFRKACLLPSKLLWPRGVTHELCSSARTLGTWIQIPLNARMSVCVYSVFVLSRV